MISIRAAAAAVGLFGILGLAGCGSGPATADVSGSASVDGVPIEDGHISFFPADGQGATAGGLIKAGKYEVKGAPVGKMKVVVSSSKVVGKKKVYDTPDSPEMPVTKEVLPTKFSSPGLTELTYDVKSGKNEKNWDLPSK